MSLIRTFAPILFPVNWTSEQLVDAHARTQLFIEFMAKEAPDVSAVAVDWPLGYGSLAHDALPVFFQPTAQLSIPITPGSESDTATSLQADSVLLYCYDDALAVAVIDLRFQPIDQLPDDHEISRLVSRLLERYVAPIASTVFDALSADQGALLAPQSYYNFSTYDRAGLTACKPLWVARMVLLDGRESPADTQRWRAWVGEQGRGDKLLLGSGNSLCIGDINEHQDALRAMLLCQFYAALMWQLESIFMQRLGQFNVHINRSNRMRQSLRLADKIEQQIDHLEYVSLQFSTAMYGTQGQRRAFVRNMVSAWQLERQQGTVAQIAELLRRRIGRLSAERNAYQNRMIQQILGIIGGLSVVDLFLALTAFSRDYPDDEVPGLLDVVAQTPSDYMLSASLLVVSVIAVVVVRYQR